MDVWGLIIFIFFECVVDIVTTIQLDSPSARRTLGSPHLCPQIPFSPGNASKKFSLFQIILFKVVNKITVYNFICLFIRLLNIFVLTYYFNIYYLFILNIDFNRLFQYFNSLIHLILLSFNWRL